MTIVPFDRNQFDRSYGVVREPDGTKPWELEMTPKSKAMLDSGTVASLRVHAQACREPLLRYAPKWITFIWVVDTDGKFHIAVEELAAMEPSNLSGAPRLRRHHPSETKKLGHPSLVGGAVARIAGELFVDEVGGEISWWVNCDSGRYCKRLPPDDHQKATIVSHFRALLGDGLQLDEIEART